MEDAHREAIRLYEEALSRYQQLGYAGYQNNLDPDVEIVTDSTGLLPNSLAEAHVASDFDAQIVVRDINLAQNPEVMYHETAHIYVISKNGMFDSDSPGYTAGMHALHESIAYILDEISRGSIAGLQHPNAHINTYVDSPGAAAANAQILQQAFYKWISTPNSTNIQMAEKILLRSVPLLSQCSGGSSCLYIVDAVNDVLEMMDDSDEITGAQETAIRNDFFAAMGSVGLGHLAQPPGGTPPPPPPVPLTPFVTHQFFDCIGGATWYTVSWSPVPHADTYRGYIDFEIFRGSAEAPPAWYGPVNNYNPNLHLHACGPGGCSGHSNSVPVYDVCE